MTDIAENKASVFVKRLCEKIPTFRDETHYKGRIIETCIRARALAVNLNHVFHVVSVIRKETDCDKDKGTTEFAWEDLDDIIFYDEGTSRALQKFGILETSWQNFSLERPSQLTAGRSNAI